MHTIVTLLRQIQSAYAQFTPFRDHEAWYLFRIAAIAEAVGWTALIIGIVCSHLPVTWHDIPVAIAGRIHGMLFIAYVMAALAFGSSLGWSIMKTIIAVCFSAPPYGSIVFEQWEHRRRQTAQARRIHHLACYRFLLTNGSTMQAQA